MVYWEKKTGGNEKMKIKDMALCALFAAVIAVFSQIAIPLGAIPFSMGIFAVMLCGVVLGSKRGVIAVLVYILIGAVGLPVFSGFRGGPQMLVGPTGGYITGYVLMALVIGLVSERVSGSRWKTGSLTFLAILLGVAVCYLFGTVQFMIVGKKGFVTALTLCVVPFIGVDLVKSVIAAALGDTLRRSIGRLGVRTENRVDRLQAEKIQK